MSLQVLGHVKIGFVERQRLDDRRVLGEDLSDLLGDGLVDLEAGLHEDQVRALPLGRHRRHRRADAELSGFVARRRDNATLAEPPTATGLPRSSGLSRCSTDA